MKVASEFNPMSPFPLYYAIGDNITLIGSKMALSDYEYEVFYIAEEKHLYGS